MLGVRRNSRYVPAVRTIFAFRRPKGRARSFDAEDLVFSAAGEQSPATIVRRSRQVLPKRLKIRSP
jgi:hypothetical protein